MPEHFLKRKVEVADAGRTMTHIPGAQGRPEAFDPATGRILLTGLHGSGRRALAVALAERLGMEVLDLDTGPSRSVEDLLQSLRGRQGVVVVVPGTLAAEERAREPLRQAGRVIAIMADVPLLARRLELSADRLDELVRIHREQEPRILAGMQFLVQAAAPVSRQVDNVIAFLRPVRRE